MTELTAAESSVLAAVESSPGITAGDLAQQLHRRLQDVLRTVESVVRKGHLERRPVMRTRADGKQHSYNGLFAIPAPAVSDPSICPACSARRRHYEGGPDCEAVKTLRELGRSLGWRRVPFDYGKVVQEGEQMWSAFLDRASIGDMRAAIIKAKFWQTIATEQIGVAAR